MNEYVWFGFGAILIVMAVISFVMDTHQETGVKVLATVKKAVTRDNHDAGYLTYLERRQTYVFTYGGKPVEIEEKMSNIIYEEGEQVELLYQPKKGEIMHIGESRYNPTILITMALAGVILCIGGFLYQTNQPLIVLMLGALCVAFAGMQFWAMKNAMKESQKVSCKTVGVFRAEHKKRGISYYPVYELEYKGKKRRVVRSYAGSKDKSQIGQVEELHIDPLTADFAEGRNWIYQLLISVSLTLLLACLIGALSLSVNPIQF